MLHPFSFITANWQLKFRKLDLKWGHNHIIIIIGRKNILRIGVMVARLTLDQFVRVQILDPQPHNYSRFPEDRLLLCHCKQNEYLSCHCEPNVGRGNPYIEVTDERKGPHVHE